ncbi:ROK family transcriptional regulator [Kribbella sp. NPDC059898]|uniref:ROK family transcriptional regulator n=1 Tax=Kribbella sp. NPDC059898 TaxID=3346995 RepID=UPI0036540822
METARGAAQAERAANQVACLRFLADADEARTVGVLSEATGLSRPTVHAVLDDLVDAGLVEPTTPATAGPGRPARAFRFAREAGLVAAVDLGPRGARAIICDLSGHRVAYAELPTTTPADLSLIPRALQAAASSTEAAGAVRPGSGPANAAPARADGERGAPSVAPDSAGAEHSAPDGTATTTARSALGGVGVGGAGSAVGGVGVGGAGSAVGGVGVGGAGSALGGVGVGGAGSALGGVGVGGAGSAVGGVGGGAERLVRGDASASAAVDLGRLRAVGVGLPGVVEGDGRLRASLAMPGLVGLPVGELLEKELGVPVVVDNDIKLAALAEQRGGAGLGYSDVVYLQIGHRLSVSIVLNGVIRQGRHRLAGELGAQRGMRWTRNAQRGQLVWSARPTGAEVLTAAAAGDPGAQAELEDFCTQIASRIATVLLVVDPEVVVVRGGPAADSSALLRPLAAAVENELVFPERPPFVAAALGREAVVLGAVGNAFDRFSPAIYGIQDFPSPWSNIIHEVERTTH